jgi:hypothetical protein
MVEDISAGQTLGNVTRRRRELLEPRTSAPLQRWLSNRGEHAGQISHQFRAGPLPDDTSPGLSLDGILSALSDT